MTSRAARRSPLVALLQSRVTVIWLVLVAATLLSFWLGTDHGLASVTSRSVLIFMVALIKVRFVGLYFMELKNAPLALRALFETYCVLVCAALISFYLFS
ncbi:MAG TPA: cytochrome C oxidase subunit IV family protein [Pseudonocardia sp.]|jgi:hypothetical protein|uniref:cytochrome C oxidase subunit IV family protein n=1 Tax=Pseudonocardia sp. TaxID=60912 RepID=UPI002CEABD40|nr:cytochrome C oxidase subunit IV family protein [Pseudonocardia sp.]HTF54750.1 cytochrome C oxidase subunit IV family protein [Pseudonocardia sp.]